MISNPQRQIGMVQFPFDEGVIRFTTPTIETPDEKKATIVLRKVDNVKYDVTNEYHGITGHCSSLNHAIEVVLAALPHLPKDAQVSVYRKEGRPSFASHLTKLPNERTRYWSYRWTCANITIEVDRIGKFEHYIRFFKNGHEVGKILAPGFSVVMRMAMNEARHSYGLEYDDALDEFYDPRLGRIASRS